MIKIVPAHEQNIPDISKLFCDNFKTTIKAKFGEYVCRAYFKEILKNKNYHLLIAYYQLNPAGFCMCHTGRQSKISNKWVFNALPSIMIHIPFVFMLWLQRRFELLKSNAKDKPPVIFNDQISIQNSCYIDYIAVCEIYRQKTIGSALLKEVERLAQKHLLKTICLSVFSVNENAINFYRVNGFKERSFNGYTRSYIFYKSPVINE